MSETKATKNWFARRVEAETKKDAMPYSERAGNIVAVVVNILVILYFVAHQTWSTGFFISKFGTLEAFLFYGVLVYQIVPTTLKALFGRKNLARLFDTIGSVLFTVALAWLFVVFPFDFAYFADVLPDFLRFLLQWISNDVARVLIVLALIVATVMALYQGILYVFVRRELSQP